MLFENQFALLNACHEEVQISPGAVGDFIAVLDGEIYLLGVPYAECPGATYEEKQVYLRDVLHKDMQNLAQTARGFAVKLKKDMAIALPPTYMTLVTAGSKDVEAIRRGVYSAEFERTHKYLQEAIENTLHGKEDQAMAAWLNCVDKEINCDERPRRLRGAVRPRHLSVGALVTKLGSEGFWKEKHFFVWESKCG